LEEDTFPKVKNFREGHPQELVMEFTLGTEARDEFYDLELAHAAHKLVTEVRPVEAGHQVLITADTGSDARVVRATARAVFIVGGIPTVIWYPSLPEPMQKPPEPVAVAVTGADVWIDYAVAYQLYSPAYFAALQSGCIYVCLTGMDVDMMVRTIGRVSYPPLQKMATRLYELSQAADTVRVTSPAGTDLTMQIDKAGDHFWEPPPVEGGYPQMLGGQSGFMAHRESYAGNLVFDGALWPPAELGVLHTPVRLSIDGGYVKKIEGGTEATLFARWLEGFEHPEAYLMDHACYGFNPGVTRPSGRILEDERIFGCMQFGVGATEYGSPAHTDGVVLNPSAWLDDTQIEEEGRYVHPELAALCRAIGAPGY
jgi:leucyl aminopeptidase (aminopeptidase T)